ATVLVERAVDQTGEMIEVDGFVLGLRCLDEQFVGPRLVEIELLLDENVQFIALDVRNVAVDGGGMHEQRRCRQAIVVVPEMGGMLLAFRHFGEKFAESLEHGAVIQLERVTLHVASAESRGRTFPVTGSRRHGRGELPRPAKRGEGRGEGPAAPHPNESAGPSLQPSPRFARARGARARAASPHLRLRRRPLLVYWPGLLLRRFASSNSRLFLT